VVAWRGGGGWRGRGRGGWDSWGAGWRSTSTSGALACRRVRPTPPLLREGADDEWLAGNWPDHDARPIAVWRAAHTVSIDPARHRSQERTIRDAHVVRRARGRQLDVVTAIDASSSVIRLGVSSVTGAFTGGDNGA